MDVVYEYSVYVYRAGTGLGGSSLRSAAFTARRSMTQERISVAEAARRASEVNKAADAAASKRAPHGIPKLRKSRRSYEPDPNKPKLSFEQKFAKEMEEGSLRLSATLPEVFDESTRGGRRMYLNRPQAMNALTLPMIRRLKAYLIVRSTLCGVRHPRVISS